MSISSPCISVCQMDSDTGWCKGCYRTIAEIVAWGQGSEAYQRAVWASLPERHAKAAFAEAKLNERLMSVCKQQSA